MGTDPKERHLEPTLESGAAFAARGLRGPILMLNLLRFRKAADYSAAPKLAPKKAVSGEAAFELYLERALPVLRACGGELLLQGSGGAFVVGPPGERWDRVLLIRQRGMADLIRFAFHAEHRAAFGHRAAALEDSRVLPLTELKKKE